MCISNKQWVEALEDTKINFLVVVVVVGTEFKIVPRYPCAPKSQLNILANAICIVSYVAQLSLSKIVFQSKEFHLIPGTQN